MQITQKSVVTPQVTFLVLAVCQIRPSGPTEQGSSTDVAAHILLSLHFLPMMGGLVCPCAPLDITIHFMKWLWVLVKSGLKNIQSISQSEVKSKLVHNSSEETSTYATHVANLFFSVNALVCNDLNIQQPLFLVDYVFNHHKGMYFNLKKRFIFWLWKCTHTSCSPGSGAMCWWTLLMSYSNWRNPHTPA